MGVRWKLGDGKSVRFCEDWWSGNCSLATQFWGLYIIANKKKTLHGDGVELKAFLKERS